MVHVPGSGEIGSGVAQHHIRLPAQGLFHPIDGALMGDIGLKCDYSRYGGYPLQVHSHYPPAGELGCHLQPASRRCPQVHHAVTPLDNMELFIYLEQLVGGAGQVALLLGFPVVVVFLISGHCIGGRGGSLDKRFDQKAGKARPKRL